MVVRLEHRRLLWVLGLLETAQAFPVTAPPTTATLNNVYEHVLQLPIGPASVPTSAPTRQTATRPLPPLPDIEDRGVLAATHAFSGEANWLVPGRVLVGRYPGSDPFLPATPPEQLMSMADVVSRANVGTFVSLQTEVPAQDDTEAWGPTLKVPYKNWRNGFANYGKDAAEAARALGRRRPRFVHFPINEGEAVQPLARLHLLVQSLKCLLTKEEAIYLHCWSGCGRTGLVAACLLGSMYDQLDAQQAMYHVNSYFHLRSDLALARHKRSPESPEQAEQVRAYFKTYLGR